MILSQDLSSCSGITSSSVKPNQLIECSVFERTSPRSIPLLYIVSVPRLHVKTGEGSGHQAYPDVSPRNVNCARPHT